MLYLVLSIWVALYLLFLLLDLAEHGGGHRGGPGPSSIQATGSVPAEHWPWNEKMENKIAVYWLAFESNDILQGSNFQNSDPNPSTEIAFINLLQVFWHRRY